MTEPARDRAAVVECAIQIADSEGLDGLTMRGLARQLELAPMTLYGYFDSRDDLLDAMADVLLGRFQTPAPASTHTPASYLVALAEAFRDLMVRHPSVAHLLSSRSTFAIEALTAAMERPLHDLMDVGFDARTAVHAYGAVLTYTLGFTTYQLPRPWGGDDELRRQQVALYQSLPLSSCPTVVEHAAALATLPSEDQFRWTIRLLGEAIASDASTAVT